MVSQLVGQFWEEVRKPVTLEEVRIPVASAMGFSSLDGLLGSFDLKYDVALQNDAFIRTSVRNLHVANPYIGGHILFLSKVKPLLSVRYLIAALSSLESRDFAADLLVGYGPSKEVDGPLVGALANPVSVGVVKYVLSKHGACKETVVCLVRAFGNPERSEPAQQVMLIYGSSPVTAYPMGGALSVPERSEPAFETFLRYGYSPWTVSALVGALNDPASREIACDALVIYGMDALPFIRPPTYGTTIYEPLMKVLNTIKTGAK